MIRVDARTKMCVDALIYVELKRIAVKPRVHNGSLPATRTDSPNGRSFAGPHEAYTKLVHCIPYRNNTYMNCIWWALEERPSKANYLQI